MKDYLFLKEKSSRIYSYSLLLSLVLLTCLLVNSILAHSWLGYFGQFVELDFLAFYSAGILLKTDPHTVYNLASQLSVEAAIVAPNPLTGSGVISHPPTIFPLFSLLAEMPVYSALCIWLAGMFVCLSASSVLLSGILNSTSACQRKDSFRIFACIFFTAPCLIGLQAGQMHALILLLCSLACLARIKNQHILCGVACGLMAIKPQFVIGFLLMFLMEKNIKAIISLLVSQVFLSLLAVNFYGTEIFTDYISALPAINNLPWTEGFPRGLLVTPLGLLAGLSGSRYHALQILLAMLISFSVVVAAIVFFWRNRSEENLRQRLAMAIIIPALATPYFMFYDLLILIPFFVLLQNNQKKWGKTVFCSHLISFPILFAGAITGVSVGALGIAYLFIKTFKNSPR